MPPEYKCRSCGIITYEPMPLCFSCTAEMLKVERGKYATMYKFWDSQIELEDGAGKALGEELLKMAREQLKMRRPKKKPARNQTASSTKKRYVARKVTQQPARNVCATVSSEPIVIKRPRLIP